MTCIIQKPDGRRQAYNRDKVLKRLFAIMKPDHAGSIDINRIVIDVERAMPESLTTTQLLSRVAERTARLASHHPHYDNLAAQIELTNLYETTPGTFSECCGILAAAGVLTSHFVNDVRVHIQYLDALANCAQVYPYTYSAVRTMERLLLLDRDRTIVERPSYMFLRVAVHLHGTDIAAISRIYHQLAQNQYVLDITTLANAGTHRKELSANYMLALDASYTARVLYSSLAQCAAITDSVGDVAISFNTSSGKGALQHGNRSLGLLPILDLFNSALSVNLNGETALQSCMSMYIEPWHSDIIRLLDVIKRSEWTAEDPPQMRHVLWIPDLFLRRAHDNASWSLFSPSETPFLANNFGAAFDAAYAAYEADGRVDKTVIDAYDLLQRILDCQIQTGQPAIMFKEACNYKSNQSHLGVITHGGLNTDFVQYCSPSQTAVVHAASVVLPAFISHKTFDFKALQGAVDSLTIALNMAIDKSSYPTPQAKLGALTHRSLGIGIEGLADTFLELDIAYDSHAARTLNHRIIETMHFASLSASTRYAETHGCYPSYANSPLANGRLQPDIWNHPLTNRLFDWTSLRKRLCEHGAANSLLISLHHRGDIPNLTGYSNNVEPITSNLITRECSPRSYMVITPTLVERLSALGTWSNDLRQQIIASNGSVQSIPNIPANIKALYKTAYELGPMPIVEMAVDRAPFVCHSQTMTIFMSDPTTTKLSAMLDLAWQSGLKSGLHILHTLPRETTPEVPGPLISSSSLSPVNDTVQSVSSFLSSPELELAELPPFDVLDTGLDSDIGEDSAADGTSFVRFSAQITEVNP